VIRILCAKDSGNMIQEHNRTTMKITFNNY